MVSRAANIVEKMNTGYRGEAATIQDVSNPANDPGAYGDPSGEMMKALTWNGKNSVKLVEVPKPKILEDKDIIVKVTGSTICGSDLHLFHGVVPQLQKGDILGHEFCGVVDSVGSGVTKHAPGDRVVASFQIACGDCWYCDRKLSSQCTRTNADALEQALYGARTAGMFGYAHLTGGYAGGQAEFTRVPFGDVNLLKLPDGVPDEKGLYLSDVLATSYHAVHDTGIEKDDVVAIWGAGPIGQMCASYALQAGASRVIMIDKVKWRLDMVREKCGDKVELLNFEELEKGQTVVTRLKEMVENRGPDVAIECAAGEYPKGWMHTVEIAAGLETDTAELVNEMIEGVRNFGRAGITGIYAGFTNHFNIGSLMERGIRLIGNGQAPVHLYWEKLLKMIEDGEIEPLQMVSHRIGLEDIETIYQKFDERADGLQKVFIATRFSNEPCEGAPQLTKY